MIEAYLIVAVAVAVMMLVGRAVARGTGIPSAIPLVLLGVAASFVPTMSKAVVPPEFILNLYLPLLVYRAAFLTAPRETKEDAVPISVMAFGLTCATALAVMAAVRLVLPEVGWPVALALGAAVAPTDPVSATSIMRRLGTPRRLVTILEGESLVNDAVALTLFGLALTALIEPVTLAAGALLLVRVVAGGVLYGLALGWVVGRLRGRITDPGAQIVLSLITPFVAYLPAEHFGLSGVLATISTGFYLGTRAHGLLQPASRLTGNAFWEVLVLLLESSLFVLLGLEIRQVIAGVSNYSVGMLATTAVVVLAAVVVLRLLWTMIAFRLARWLPGRHLSFDRVGRRERLVMGWAGMRGAITLAVALSIPLSVANRPLMIFLAAVVVLVTLLGQATTLAPLLRRLGLGESKKAVLEEARARRATAEAALSRLEDLASDDRVDEHTAEVFRQLYELRLDRARAVLEESDGDEDKGLDEPGLRWLRKQLARAQREEVDELYAKGKISATTQRHLIHELDLEERRRASDSQ
ncbi:Na+/H+ antiporter [Sphaerisporangium krabiense]|uniref:CPA1 family monovalent cation:H+ antiporter n=1 Tax=Sphaerisporangium krabiense TaxID=763782 RepID=A0A7W8Z710_9ACTN|nr:Na+/H+ antiporter [Sphaerisporangium krabiense]MBB5628562.1 CPA1 family monovalent cation:H+ antiporter [Sphaerisporangium krabiense]GII67203.1 Na+/H+ antiporter [Sphaerisporangium krabiense]